MGLKGAKSRSQEPTAGALCGGLGPGLTEGQGTEQQDTTVEEAFPVTIWVDFSLIRSFLSSDPSLDSALQTFRSAA